MAKYLITSLNDLQLQIKLGVTAEERLDTQLVKISFFLYQQILPSSTLGINEESYICYNEVAELINSYCHNKEFKVIEFLCYQLYQLIKGIVSTDTKVRVITEKFKPAMDLPAGSSQCEYGDIEY